MITLDSDSAVPPFEQVRFQLAAQITSGALAPGTRLPPVRQLATDLALAANTVARSYRDLEAAGLVETRGRNGTVVTAAGDRARGRLQRAAERYATLAHDLGITPSEALRFVQTAVDPASELTEPTPEQVTEQVTERG